LTGYYAAITVSPGRSSGRVTGIGYEPELAARAKANFTAYPNVDIVEGEGAPVLFDQADECRLYAAVELSISMSVSTSVADTFLGIADQGTPNPELSRQPKSSSRIGTRIGAMASSPVRASRCRRQLGKSRFAPVRNVTRFGAGSRLSVG
jgi:hypothetical protein